MQNQRIVVYEMSTSQLLPKMILGGVGLLTAAGMAYWAYHNPSEIGVIAAIAFATVAFGVAMMMAWRKRGEYEILEFKDGRILILTSQSKIPAFDATRKDTKFQRLRLPGGMVQLYMRADDKAVEFAKSLSQKQRDALAAQVENILAPASAATLPSGEMSGQARKEDLKKEDRTLSEDGKPHHSLSSEATPPTPSA